jgi:hypothetical protein
MPIDTGTEKTRAGTWGATCPKRATREWSSSIALRPRSANVEAALALYRKMIFAFACPTLRSGPFLNRTAGRVDGNSVAREKNAETFRNAAQ